MKAYIMIEETLCKKIAVDVPKGSTLDSEAVINAAEKVINDYKNNKIVLGPEDFNGCANFCIETEDGSSTGWYN